MHACTKIILFALVTAVATGILPAQIFSGSYTYQEPVAIVDETIKKTSEQGLKKKLSRLEEALEAEVRRQLAIRMETGEKREGIAGGMFALQPAPVDVLVRIDAPAAGPTSG